MTCRPRLGTHVTLGSSTPALSAPRSHPSSGARTTAFRSTPTGTPSRMMTSAKPTRETLPSATMRGSRCNRPSGVRPLAGLSTPAASSGLPGSGVMITPRRVNVYGTVFWMDKRSTFHAGAELRGGEVLLECHEQRHRRSREDDCAGQDRAQGVGGAPGDVADVVREGHRQRLQLDILGDQEGPEELVPRPDEGQEGGGHQGGADQGEPDRPEDSQLAGTIDAGCRKEILGQRQEELTEHEHQ